MSELRMWEYLQPKLKLAGLHAERLTDRLNEGIPDVLWVSDAGTTGLLELKYLPSYPKRADVPWLTYGTHGLQPAQAFWANRWARKGGRTFVLLRVGSDDWYLWRARGEPDWLKWIVSVEANREWDAAWRPPAHKFSVESLKEALCRAR